MPSKPEQMRMTLTEHMLLTQPKESKCEFTLLNVAIMTAIKAIEKNVRRAGLRGTLGYADNKVTNATGDNQAKLDIITNEIFKASLTPTGSILIMGSEEENHGVLVEAKHRGNYLICFDPIDGSSNIDANVSIGTIWGIWKVDPRTVNITTQADVDKAILQKGSDLVSAGYANYSSATNLVLTTGQGVNGFTLDSSIGEFVMTHPNMKMGNKKIYSVNEGNQQFWAPWFKAYIESVKQGPKPYGARYVGSMVADVHRTILYGGLFCYPDDAKSKSGKLRFLYEAAPMALLVEQAGGLASTGNGRVLDVTPTQLHERVPIFLGSRDEVEKLLAFKKQYQSSSKL